MINGNTTARREWGTRVSSMLNQEYCRVEYQVCGQPVLKDTGLDDCFGPSQIVMPFSFCLLVSTVSIY
jgi:hypothetical protein